ncbi:MAG: 30S ribosomal protein S20 [Treponema sp.]|nr:30S ribosomal protein S20 [Treponema sp.]
MARNQTSAEKRFRQSEVRRIHNKAIKSKCRTYAKKFVQAVHSKDAALAMDSYKTLQKELDSAKSKGVLKANTVARKKSRMMKLYNTTFPSSSN